MDAKKEGKSRREKSFSNEGQSHKAEDSSPSSTLRDATVVKSADEGKTVAVGSILDDPVEFKFKNSLTDTRSIKNCWNANFQIFRSKKGFEKLAYEGYIYNLDKRHETHTVWRCEMSKKPGHKCSGRVRMNSEVIEMYSFHSHPPDQLKVEADILKSRLYAAAEDPTNNPKVLNNEAAYLASYAGTSGLSGLPKLGSMQRVICRKRRHTQRLLEQLCGASSGDSLVSSSISDSAIQSPLSSLLQGSERLQFLFSPSTGVEELNPDSSKKRPLQLDTDSDQQPVELMMSNNGCPLTETLPEADLLTSLYVRTFIPTTNDLSGRLSKKRMEIQSYLQAVALDAGISDLTSYDFAEVLDEVDPLKDLRQEFFYPKMKTLPKVDQSLVNPEEDCIYMCGNSLGLMPKGVQALMEEQFEKWASMGVFGHLHEPFAWAHCDESVIEGVANLIGAQPSEVALMNTLTVNLHVLLTSFYNPEPARHKILIESKSFPSDYYAIESQIRLKGYTVENSLLTLEPRAGDDCLRTEDIISFIEQHGNFIAVIWLSGIHYYTGQLLDIKKITAAGQKKGCFVGWDLAHCFANVPLCLHEWNVDFAAWCTYKYSCSSAGGIGGLFVHKRYENDHRERMLGWWGHKFETRFLMDNRLELDTGAAGYKISNPPMMLIVPIVAFLQVMSKTTMYDLRIKSIVLTGYLEFLINYFLSPSSLHRRTKKVLCTIITPSDPDQRGCQLSLKFSTNIGRIYDELVKRGVAVDKRYPDVIRVTPVHLYNSYRDVHRFMRVLLDSLDIVERELNGDQ